MSAEAGANAGGVKVDRFNWFSEHPKFLEMMSWGFDDVGQIAATLLVYLDLCEAKNWWHTEIHPCWPLHMAYLTGKPSRKGDHVAVLPLQNKTVLSPSRLRAFLLSIEERHCKLPRTERSPAEAVIPAEHHATKSLTLAITESDSTIVYYRIADGLVAPDSGPKPLMEGDVEAEGQEEGRGKGKGKRKRVVRRGADQGLEGGAVG